jgi:hypothetical protein
MHYGLLNKSRPNSRAISYPNHPETLRGSLPSELLRLDGLEIRILYSDGLSSVLPLVDIRDEQRSYGSNQPKSESDLERQMRSLEIGFLVAERRSSLDFWGDAGYGGESCWGIQSCGGCEFCDAGGWNIEPLDICEDSLSEGSGVLVVGDIAEDGGGDSPGHEPGSASHPNCSSTW